MDAASRWETEALRESRARRGGRPTVSQDRRQSPPGPAVWVTIREASDATGIPTGTLGSWARRGSVQSYLEQNGGRKRRMVDLNAVRSRAVELGRPIRPASAPASSSSSSGGAAERGEAEGVTSPAAETMIVPIDAWNKMLLQLGNLHEAGQQLAEARERAAKAETEAAFLRERLAELRAASPSRPSEGAAEPGEADETSSPSGRGTERREAEGASTEPWMPDTPPPSATAPPPAVTPGLGLFRSLYARWASRRR